MGICIVNDIQVNYKGVIIYKNNSVGDASVYSLTDDFNTNRIDFSELFGCFSINFNNLKDNSVTFFCDNMGYMPIYYNTKSSPIFSDSLIDIVEKTKQTKIDLDWNGVFSFLEFGFCCSDLTFFKNIKKCSGNYMYIIKNNSLNIVEKKFTYSVNINDIDSYVEQLKKKLLSFKNEKLLFDITGGTDSRLLVSLAEGLSLSYDLFVRGHSNAVDIKIAKKIAKLLNRPLHILESRAFNEFTQDGFFDLLQRLDGSYMPLSGFQLLEAYEARYSSNAAYNIGGLGGEYYKTSILSLPYHSISDSYVLRILKRKRCCLSLSEIDDVLYSRYYDYDRNLIKDLSLTDNSKAYLDWYREQFFPRNAGVFYGVSTKYIPAYPPLAESIFYKWICSLPFKLKVFKLFYRKIIMRENRALANLETSFGFSLSMSPIKFLKDLFITFILIIRRIISRFTLKNLYITSSIQVSDATDMLKLKTSVFFEEVSDFLQKEKILSSTKRLSDMPLKKIDRFLVLWFWLHKLNNDS